ncbi:MAG: DegV family protein, partial [Lachnospiraceae bacterium]
MAKVAIMTDSNSGITQKEGRNLGISVLPMPFIMDGETYFEDITLTQEKFYERLQDNCDISTSQPSPESVTNMFDALLQEYDEVVHIPMSSGLSGSCQTAHMLAEDYKGRVQVVNNQRISVTQRQSVMDAIALAEAGKSAAEVKKILEEDKFNSSIYIMLDTLYYLKKGGRITPAAAALGTILKLKPVLTIQGEKLDAFAKARTSSQGKKIMINAIKNDIETRFNGIDHVQLQMAYTYNEESALQFKREVEQEFPGL